jgi:hypothetical protein
MIFDESDAILASKLPSSLPLGKRSKMAMPSPAPAPINLSRTLSSDPKTPTQFSASFSADHQQSGLRNQVSVSNSQVSETGSVSATQQGTPGQKHKSPRQQPQDLLIGLHNQYMLTEFLSLCSSQYHRRCSQWHCSSARRGHLSSFSCLLGAHFSLRSPRQQQRAERPRDYQVMYPDGRMVFVSPATLEVAHDSHTTRTPKKQVCDVADDCFLSMMRRC